MFPIIRQFDIDKCRQFFGQDKGFMLGKYLLEGADGITSYAANYSVEKQIDLAKQSETAITALVHKLISSCSSYTIGPDCTSKRASFS